MVHLTLALSGRLPRLQARGRRKLHDAPTARQGGACHGPLERVVRLHGSLFGRSVHALCDGSTAGRSVAPIDVRSAFASVGILNALTLTLN